MFIDELNERILPGKINIDGIECELKWTEHVTIREIQRKRGSVKVIVNTLRKAATVLDFPFNTYIWVRNHAKKISVLICIRRKHTNIIIELITFLNKIASPNNVNDKIVDLYLDKIK